MPQLIEHQLKVAVVGKVMSENWKSTCSANEAIKLCLVHDMGNIVKFDLSPEKAKTFGEIENLGVWQEIQKKYIDKYGSDAHEATKAILADANLSFFNPLIDEEAKLYFMEAKESELKKSKLSSIILMYADCRVTPKGITSYRERIDDLKTRYGGSSSPTWYEWTYWFDEWITKQVTIDPKNITDEVARPLFDELLEIEV